MSLEPVELDETGGLRCSADSAHRLYVWLGTGRNEWAVTCLDCPRPKPGNGFTYLSALTERVHA